MRPFFSSLCVIGVLALTACGSTNAAASPTATAALASTATPASETNTILMDSGAFLRGTDLTIKVGQTVTFRYPNPTSFAAGIPAFPRGGGFFHQLVTGTNGHFSAAMGAPSEFATADGLFIHIGDTKMVLFTHAGVFHITCIIHPGMQATITVTT